MEDGSVGALTNSILWNDTATDGSEIALRDFGEPSALTVSYCAVEGGEGAAYVGGDSILNWDDTNLEADPAFAFGDDFHLMPGSPCIDTGTNDPPGGLPDEDFDGNSRVLDGDGDNVAIADMGACEHDPIEPTIALSPTEVLLRAHEDEPGLEDLPLQIRNAGGGVLNWAVAHDCLWLSTTPSQGDSTGEIDETLLHAAAAGLTRGHYSCDLFVTDDAATNSPRTVRVTLRVLGTLHVPSEYATIQAAIDAAYHGETVLVDDGTYTGDGNKNLDFWGKAITVRSMNGPGSCVIDCEGSGRGFDFRSYEGPESRVVGFTITGGSLAGAVRCQGCSPAIVDCLIIGNSTTSGGGIYCLWGAPNITNCAITDNSAYNGAAIYSTQSSPTVSNCLIIRNAASSSGGGVYFYKGNPIISNCTFALNAADSYGGALYCRTTESETSLANCVLWSNSAPQGSQVALTGIGTLAIAYSDIQDGQSGVLVDDGCTLHWQPGNIDADPLFADPANNDYHLSPGSPCIDAADNEAVPADELDLDGDGDTEEPMPFDLDGNLRFVDDPCTEDTGNGDPPIVDMGAYEYHPCTGDVDCDGDTDHSDLGGLLSAWCSHDGDPNWNPDADLDGDGHVGHGDLGILLADWDCGT